MCTRLLCPTPLVLHRHKRQPLSSAERRWPRLASPRLASPCKEGSEGVSEGSRGAGDAGRSAGGGRAAGVSKGERAIGTGDGFALWSSVTPFGVAVEVGTCDGRREGGIMGIERGTNGVVVTAEKIGATRGGMEKLELRVVASCFISDGRHSVPTLLSRLGSRNSLSPQSKAEHSIGRYMASQQIN
ncbi:uncharacterized protein IWZ02DRAFT_273824 [Phyllosticta citriasiana]|uniref:uncharacterized protein n=1 Tax=Phyllosticta citriasiana TaxID=595635 RepID=UPI0030FD5E2E